MKPETTLEEAIMNDQMDEWRQQKRREYLADSKRSPRRSSVRSWHDIPIATLAIIAAVIFAIVEFITK